MWVQFEIIFKRQHRSISQPIKNTNVVLLLELVLTSPGVIQTIAIEKLNRNTIIITAQLKHKITSVNRVDPHKGGL